MRLLLIEDDKNLLKDVIDEAEKNYIVDVVSSGSDGAYLSQVNDYDVMVVDSNLPDIDGVEVCKMTRDADVNTPILLLSEDSESSHRVKSLDAGADVTFPKPVNVDEFMAQLRALSRRNGMLSHSSVIKVGKVEVDFKKKQAYVNKKPILLRRKEFDLLEYLLLNKGRVVSKEEILEHVWDQGIYVFSNTVEVHIKSLRGRLSRFAGKKFIKTVRGFGYKIDA
ncbi:MAG: response regulator transcription factor [Patescibacteria group bacterium]